MNRPCISDRITHLFGKYKILFKRKLYFKLKIHFKMSTVTSLKIF